MSAVLQSCSLGAILESEEIRHRNDSEIFDDLFLAKQISNESISKAVL